jgi:large repetitive protein
MFAFLSRVLLIVLGIFLSAAAARANNTFPGTTISGASSNLSASNVGATGEAGEPTTYGGGSLNTMWYSWTAPGSGSVTFETCGNPQTTFDTTLQSFTGSAVNALTLLAQNDDTGGCPVSVHPNYGSRITWNVTQGTVYRVQVDGYASTTGTFRLTWNFTGFSISKSAFVSSISAPGTITYTIAVANAGAATLTGLSISDSLLLGASVRTLSSGPALTSGDTNGNGQLNITETWVYTATYNVPQSDIDLGGTYSNTAIFDSAQTSAFTSNAATTSITQSPSFSNVKTQSGGSNPVTAAGQMINYAITIANTGNVTLTSPTLVSDNFQLGGSARSFSSGPAYTSGDTNSDGAIDVGETWAYSASYIVTQADLDANGDFTNTATYDTDQTAQLASNMVTTPVTRIPSLAIDKYWAFANPGDDADGDGFADVGDIITYYYDVTNDGNVTLTDLTTHTTATIHLAPSRRPASLHLRPRRQCSSPLPTWRCRATSTIRNQERPLTRT